MSWIQLWCSAAADSSTWSLKTTIYESGTVSAFEAERMGADPSWMVSVLKVGADDASNGSNEATISPRMVARNERQATSYLPNTKDRSRRTTKKRRQMDNCLQEREGWE